MIRLGLHETAKCLACAPPDPDIKFTGVSIDSRKVAPGNLFAALSGRHSDGHDYVATAAEAGAAAALVSKPLNLELPQLVVKDVQAALGTLAAAWRSRMDARAVAITGSNGKTTTKEMVTNILAGQSDVLSTQGNFNNELGLPLTLFGLGPDHDFAVLEMGAAKVGDIRYLARIAQPEVGLITNVGPAHLQGFGSEKGVARAKGEIYQELPASGVAIINGDEPWEPLWREMSAAGKIIVFGRGPACDVTVADTAGGVEVQTPAGAFPLKLSLPGEHNVQNALAATAAALALEIPLDQVRTGLEQTRPVPGRLNIVHSDGGWTVIDDTYNANPASLYAALQVLSRRQGERWLVLGDMKELGRDSRKMHAEMGEAARALGVVRLLATGDSSHATVDAFGDGGRHFSDVQALIDHLCAELEPGVTCLVKGSRSMGMERAVQAISQDCSIREAG